MREILLEQGFQAQPPREKDLNRAVCWDTLECQLLYPGGDA